MTVESAQNKGVRFYVSDSFPLKWKYSHSILENNFCGDPIIYSEASQLYILVNIAHNLLDFNTDLFKFSLNDDLRLSNFQNQIPILSSTKGGRNAGMIEINGELRRIGQIQGYLQYGKGITISDESLFKSESFMFLNPASKYIGIHTLNSNENLITYDMSKYKSIVN